MQSQYSHIAVMPKRTLTVRGVPDAQLKRLRARAAANHRSLNGELLAVLERAAQEADPPAPAPSRVREPVVPPSTGRRDQAPSFMETVDREALAAVCRRYHIQWLALFGSHAGGNVRSDSDVDVLVDFAPGRTPGFGIVRVAEALRPVLGGRRVDLVTRRGLPRGLLEQVMASVRPLYAA